MNIVAFHDSNPTPPWLSIAWGEVGVTTYAAGLSNPRITAYHAGTNIAGYDDKASWCSSFVNWSLAQAGIAGTGSALAHGPPRLRAPIVMDADSGTYR